MMALTTTTKFISKLFQAATASLNQSQRCCLQTSAACFGKAKFIEAGIDINKYTMRPLPMKKSGGRGFDGRVQTHHVGGGHKQRYRMVDFKRDSPKTGGPVLERIQEVRYDPCRTANIAVVATGNRKRYIIAGEFMEAGNIIKSHGEIPLIPVVPVPGDSHPLGALPVGTVVHNVEMYEGCGGKIARAAGSSAMVVNQIRDRTILRMPSKREMNVANTCMCTVGRVSNVDHGSKPIGSAARSRWLGIRPQSGKWHRKTGYNGRKIKPIKKQIVYDKPPTKKEVLYRTN